jgi:phosphatidylglycerol---prolipoprotein diacylglyceryl transferase
VSPELFSLGPITIRWYGLLFALGFLFGFQLMTKVFDREKKSIDDLNQLFYYVIIGTVVGARLGHCLFYDPQYYLSDPLEILKIWHGGLASHGGGIGIVTGVYLYSRRHPDQKLLWLLDRLTIPTMLGASFIRLGNLFNSEIIGNTTDVPWAFIFEKVDLLPRHPTQLYEAIIYVFIFGLLFIGYWKFNLQNREGLLLGSLLTSVFSARILIEFVKERQENYADGLPLNVGQLLSIPAILIGLYLIFRSLNPPGRTV